jgi:hypothetical protein
LLWPQNRKRLPEIAIKPPKAAGGGNRWLYLSEGSAGIDHLQNQ